MNKGYKDSERIVSFSGVDDNQKSGIVHSGLAHDLRKYDFEEIESISVIDKFGAVNFKIEKENEEPFYNKIECLCADTAITDVLGLGIIEGDIVKAKRVPNSGVITRSTAEQLFGKESPVGKTITLAGVSIPLTINCVIEDFPDNISLQNEKPEMILLSFEFSKIKPESFYSIIGFTGVAKLKQGFNKDDLNKRISEVNYIVGDGDMIQTVECDYYTNPSKNSNKTTLILYILVLGLIVLISAIMNYFIFIIGISKNRASEYALRNVLGSSKSSLYKAK